MKTLTDTPSATDLAVALAAASTSIQSLKATIEASAWDDLALAADTLPAHLAKLTQCLPAEGRITAEQYSALQTLAIDLQHAIALGRQRKTEIAPLLASLSGTLAD